MKVLYVINGLGTGGAERSLAEMLPVLRDRGIEPRVACLYRRREGVEPLVGRDRVAVDVLPHASWLRRIRALRRILREVQPDLLHTTIFESDQLARIAAVGTNVPVLTSLVNTSYEPIRLQDPHIQKCRLEATRLIDGWTARHLTTGFHAITDAVKRSAVHRLGIPAEAITVIHRGRQPARLTPPSNERRVRTRRRFGIEDQEVLLVNVARQEFQKGQRFLLEAMADLVQRRSGLKLLIAGREGAASPELHELTEKLGLESTVAFTGHLDDVEELLAASDLFVFPSLYEGLGGALIEAMAMALPIVASDLEATREILEAGENSLLVPKAQPSELAAAIETLLDAPQVRCELGARSREIFESRFTLDRSVDEMVALYRRLVSAT